MKYDIQVNQGAAEWSVIRDAINAAETSGFDTAWVLDHLSSFGRSDVSMIECFTALGALAEATATSGAAGRVAAAGLGASLPTPNYVITHCSPHRPRRCRTSRAGDLPSASAQAHRRRVAGAPNYMQSESHRRPARHSATSKWPRQSLRAGRIGQAMRPTCRGQLHNHE